MRKTASACLVLLLASLAASPSGAQDELGKAFSAARASVPSAAPVRAAAGFVPQGCSVETWCLVKATDCFLGRVTRPTGLWQAYAQYSVVRRAVALCPDGYGRWTRRTFMGPVEPQVFTSAIETEEKTASDAAVKLCSVYRKDWVDAAPACPAE